MSQTSYYDVKTHWKAKTFPKLGKQLSSVKRETCAGSWRRPVANGEIIIFVGSLVMFMGILTINYHFQ